MGGRLTFFAPAWATICRDKFVLRVVAQGYYIPLGAPIPLDVARPWHARVACPSEGLLSEISLLLEKGAVEPVQDHPGLCLSPIFVIPKRSGKLRLILNIKRINAFIPKPRFRMETLSYILPLLQRDDWAVSIDLRDAYHHVSIDPGSRDLLGFSVGGQTYRFRALPFGLRTAPWLFTRVVSVVAAHLREQGLRVFYYLDDWLLVADSQDLLLKHLSLLLNLVQKLGFIVNWEKSALLPSRTPTYLGAVIDLPALRARPTPERVDKVLSAVLSLSSVEFAPAEEWVRALGYLASLKYLVPDCLLYMRPLQIHLNRHFRPLRDPPSKRVPVTPEVRACLSRWACRDLLSQGRPLHVPLPSVTVVTDASLYGWGGHCAGVSASGRWSLQERHLHINVLEFRAVRLCLQQFLPLVQSRAVLIQTDNVTVAAYINKQGGTHSRSLNIQALEFWTWCLQREITPSASHIPGLQNLSADCLSRGLSSPGEWTLSRRVMSMLKRVFGLQSVDLFASALNAQLPRFCSRGRDPGAWRVNAFTFSWTGLNAYAFPPLILLPKVLRKIREDQARVLLIAPHWPRRIWFMDLLSLLAGVPRSLPQSPSPLRDPLSDLPMPLPGSVRLTAWPLSGVISDRQAFLNGLPTSSVAATETRQGSVITLACQSTSNGARTEVFTRVLRLQQR